MTHSRRDFLASASALAIGSAISSNTYAKDTSDIRIAQIGFRGKGRGHINELRNQLVALCDVDEKILNEEAQDFEEKHGRKLDKYVDFRKLLERQDIDAVSIATPNHTHAYITVLAAQAGKDVYVEKPASHNIWEGRQMVQAARRYKRIIQCGTQSRSSMGLQKAVKFVQSGELGKIRYAIGTCYKPRPSIGKLEEPLQIPSHIHYDLWCGPAEKVDLYRPHLHYDWHWDFNTGNGDMGNQGIHQMDVARWFLGEQHLAPRFVSIGGRLGYEDAGNTPNTQIVYFDYDKAPLIFETRGLPRSKAAQKDWRRGMDNYRGSDIGVVVQCENGYVLVTRSTEIIARDNEGREIKRWQNENVGHHPNWLRALATRDSSLLNAEIAVGHVSSSLCHCGGISHQLGKMAVADEIAERVAHNDLLANSYYRMAAHLRANGVDIDSKENAMTLGSWLELDPATEQFTKNEEANTLRSRDYREPYVIPDLERESLAADVRNS